VPEIAARSGTSQTTVRRALKEASSLGLITIEERRVPYRPNLANVVRIISREWLSWIRKGGGFQKRKATENQGFQKSKMASGTGKGFAVPRVTDHRISKPSSCRSDRIGYDFLP
jgi:hypothetical protein